MSDEISQLAAALNSGDRAGQASAAERLAQLGEAAQPAAVALVRACAADEAIREWAGAALEALGPPAESDLEPMAALLNDRSADVAYWAATLLGRLAARGERATPALAAVLAASPHAIVRQRAAWALGRIGPAAATAAPALHQAAASSDKRLAELAREALGRVK